MWRVIGRETPFPVAIHRCSQTAAIGTRRKTPVHEHPLSSWTGPLAVIRGQVGAYFTQEVNSRIQAR